MSDFLALLDSVDCLLMGRKTFDTVREFNPWPYASLPVFVLSSTLSGPLGVEGANVSVRHGEPIDLLRRLEQEGFRRVYIDGGTTIHGFLREGLIDRITIATVPVILGRGRPLFPAMDNELKFKLESCVVLDSGIVKSTYLLLEKA
jgi:dihydrofolate reductase